MLRLEVGMRLDEGGAIGESRAVAVVEIGFGGQALREDDIMRVELDMPIFNRVSFSPAAPTLR